MMGRSPILRWTLFVLFSVALVFAQTSSGPNSADGLSSSAATSTATTASNATTTIAGMETTFRALFTVPASADLGIDLVPNIEDPSAPNAQDICPGYIASHVETTKLGLTADLNLAGAPCSAYGNDILNLTLTVEYQSADRLHVEIIPRFLDTSNTSFYILPSQLVNKPTVDASRNDNDFEADLLFSWSNNPSFGFTVMRASTGFELFSTQGKKLIFEDQFLEFATDLPADYNLYGLGEVIHGLRLGNNLTRTIYASDVGDPIDGNIYGSHPFYLETRYYEVDPVNGTIAPTASGANATTDSSKEYKSYSHGVYLRNSHGQEVLLRDQNVTWRTIGGSIDLYFYAGPSQVDVTKSYQASAVGFPAMQQYWTFGFHQCRWGYQNWSVVEDVVNTYADFGIALETIWTDIDYMNEYRDFSNDPLAFPVSAGQAFLQRLHASGRHYVPIVDSAIYVPNANNDSDAYDPFTKGNESDVFIKNPDGSLYIGDVWPGYTAFPDWLSSNAGSWWTDSLTTWHGDIPFDGIWIDMSEVSSFCTGSCGSFNVSMNPVHPPFALPGEKGDLVTQYPEGFNLTNATEASSASAVSSSQAAASSTASATATTSYFKTTPTPGVRNVNYPPYVINHDQGDHDLAVHAVSPNATHADGTLEYEIHNLFGHSILNATYNALLNIFPGKRPFIIGRSTFAGSGVWAGHWGGDNMSLWAYMYFSVSQALSFSLFGIPMFGVDTCGFNGNSDMELCNRWMQLSAFFPFYRNHNVIGAISQEAYRWASVADATKTAMAIRLSLLPYMYTLFYNAHMYGDTVMRALAWEFPNEPQLADVETQFLLGNAILVTPVLAQGATNVSGVFPGAISGTVWYDWYNLTAVNASAGENKTVDAPLGHIPVFVRGGCVLPMQEPGMTTTEGRGNPWGLLVALDSAGEASGELYVDDGESLVQNATLMIAFTTSNNSLSASIQGSYNDTNPLANVTVLGLSAQPSNVTLNGASVDASGLNYTDASKSLQITGLANFTDGGAWKKNWTLSWS